jgi:hypothetical protein
MSGLLLRVLPSLRHRLRLHYIRSSVWNVTVAHFSAAVLRSSAIPPEVAAAPVIRHGVPLSPAVDRLVTYVADNCIGDNDVFPGPFGERKLTYIGTCRRLVSNVRSDLAVPRRQTTPPAADP